MTKLKRKSLLFQKAADFGEAFEEHLNVLWDITKEKQKIILKRMPQVIHAETAAERSGVQDALAKEVGGDSKKVLQAVSILLYIADQWNPFLDDPQSMMRDIKMLKVLPKEKKKKDRAERFLKDFFNFLEKDSRYKIKELSASAVVPSLTGVDTAVDFRAVVESYFSWRVDNPEAYKPQCKSLIPVVLVEIRTTKRENPFFFQCELDDLGRLIRQLQATVKEVKKSQKLIR